MLEAAARLDRFPEIFAISGWSKGVWPLAIRSAPVMMAWTEVIAASAGDLCLAKT
jgi:hypothetical protein